MKKYKHCFIAFLLYATLLAGPAAFSQTSASSAQNEPRAGEKPFTEERRAAQDFIEHVNEARNELASREVDLAEQEIVMARNMLPLISRATPAQRRLTRVEFGGGLYADDLGQKKSYIPIETESLETYTRSSGPRWVKNTRVEGDAKIIYVTLDLTGGRAQAYLDQAKKALAASNFNEAQSQLDELSDKVIKIDDAVPAVIQARDYVTLADNYISVGNFFGARSSLEQASSFLIKMGTDDIYKTHYPDIISLHKNIDDLQAAFAKLDAEQIKSAEVNLKKWQQQLSGWAGE